MQIMANAFGVSVSELEDFHKNVSWTGLAENKQLFSQIYPHNAYSTFDEVGNVLAEYDKAIYRVTSRDNLTNSIVNIYE